jgi:hypothetical protein
MPLAALVKLTDHRLSASYCPSESAAPPHVHKYAYVNIRVSGTQSGTEIFMIVFIMLIVAIVCFISATINCQRCYEHGYRNVL